MMPAQAKAEYGAMTERVVEFIKNEPGTHPRFIAQAMERAMLAHRPPLRYKVGVDSQASPFAGLAPTWVLPRSRVCSVCARLFLTNIFRSVARVCDSKNGVGRLRVAGSARRQLNRLNSYKLMSKIHYAPLGFIYLAMCLLAGLRASDGRFGGAMTLL
jgi:hypothetical protein